MKRSVLVCLVALGCGDDGAPLQPDAAMLPPDAPTSCPAKMPPLSPGVHELYLNAEGVTLTKGACDDAPTNCTSLIAGSQAVVPAFLPNEATRQSSIDAIVGYVQRALAPYSIDVVTTRPSSGAYYMAVLGGSSTAIVGNNTLSVAAATCDAMNRNRISLAFDVGVNDPKFYANSIISDFGAMVGLAVTTKNNDCMCRTSPCTIDNAFICSFGVDVPVNAQVHGCGRTTQDEPALLTAALGCR